MSQQKELLRSRLVVDDESTVRLIRSMVQDVPKTIFSELQQTCDDIAASLWMRSV